MPTKIAGTYNTEYIKALNRHYAGGGKAIFFVNRNRQDAVTFSNG